MFFPLSDNVAPFCWSVIGNSVSSVGEAVFDIIEDGLVEFSAWFGAGLTVTKPSDEGWIDVDKTFH